MDQVLIFDGDDTLWSTEPLYDAARERARRLVEADGFDGARWEAIERVRDVENVASMGMSPSRFPTSCVEALDEVARAADRPASASLRERVWEAAESVFSTPAPTIPGAQQVLRTLAGDHTIALLTKGDPEIQERRIAASGLLGLIDHVEVVDRKTTSTFLEVAAHLDADVRQAVSIGNSLYSDICPAVEAGMQAVWIDAHVWEFERSHHDAGAPPAGVVLAKSILDVPNALEGLRVHQ